MCNFYGINVILGFDRYLNNETIALIDFVSFVFIGKSFDLMIYICLPWLGITGILNSCFYFNSDRKEITKQIEHEFNDFVGVMFKNFKSCYLD